MSNTDSSNSITTDNATPTATAPTVATPTKEDIHMNQLRESIIQHEWNQFQDTTNEGGRAACQGNWPMFYQMRLSQFLTWDEPLLSSYEADLEEAERVGRNLVTEKYGRMMESTVPDEYHRNIEPYIPQLSAQRIAKQERIIVQQVKWASEFRERYHNLGESMRVLTSDEDTADTTSFETYLRGELGTYSDATLALYEHLVEQYGANNANLSEATIRNTVLLGGFSSLEEAESAQ